MLKEKNPLLKLKLKKERSFIFNIKYIIFESLYSLYDLILENPIDNFWFECFNIIIGYIQLIIFMFDRTVSEYYQILCLINLVFPNMEEFFIFIKIE